MAVQHQHAPTFGCRFVSIHSNSKGPIVPSSTVSRVDIGGPWVCLSCPLQASTDVLTTFLVLCCAVLQAKVAVAAWQELLRARFRLLDRWCEYVATHHKSPVVLEDTWRQVRGAVTPAGDSGSQHRGMRTVWQRCMLCTMRRQTRTDAKSTPCSSICASRICHVRSPLVLCASKPAGLLAAPVPLQTTCTTVAQPTPPPPPLPCCWSFAVFWDALLHAQVLDFSRTVHEDLSNYDPSSAWPVLLDEFVEHLRAASSNSSARRSAEPLDMLSLGLDKAGLIPVSPRSGRWARNVDGPRTEFAVLQCTARHLHGAAQQRACLLPGVPVLCYNRML